jgi:hypothetical protein
MAPAPFASKHAKERPNCPDPGHSGLNSRQVETEAIMKHPSTRELFAYWDKARGARLAPARGDIEPGAIRRVLADTFVLSFDRAAGHPFRLAGTRVCALFGRELKSEAFTGLWEGADREVLSARLAILSEESIGMVASAAGATADGLKIDLELLLLPLAYRGQSASRVLGLLAPATPPYWLGVKPLQNLSLGSFRHVGPQVDHVAAPRLVAAPPIPAKPGFGRRRGGFTVYEGGRPSE